MNRLVAILGQVAASASADDSLGRLFFSPAERARLDALRSEAIAQSSRPRPTISEAPTPAAPFPRTLTLNGIVRRPDGEATVWINGRPIDAVAPDSPVPRDGLGRAEASVRLPDTRKALRLKVGQSVETGSGVVEEAYRQRRTAPEIRSEDAPAGPDAAPPGSGRTR